MGHEIKNLLSAWDELYQSHTGRRYFFSGGKDAKLMKELRAVYSDEDIQTFMAAFFASDDEFIQQSGYSLGAFRGCLQKVIASLTQRAAVTKSTAVTLQGAADFLRSRRRA